LVQFEDVPLNVGQCTYHRLCPLRRRPQFYREASLYANDEAERPRSGVYRATFASAVRSSDLLETHLTGCHCARAALLRQAQATESPS
jgi:hypothetical protein